jgi:glycosylphosphatidylinositol deacylase
MCLVLLLIFLFVPWQVAFLGCWAIHLHTCATLWAKLIALELGVAIPLMDRARQEANNNPSTQLGSTARLVDQSPSTTNAQPLSLDGHHLNMHILLLMTWLLPFVAPVLAVWVRTLMTAGFTVPFDSDHNFLNVAPFLLLVDSMSSGRGLDVRGRYVICQI